MCHCTGTSTKKNVDLHFGVINIDIFSRTDLFPIEGGARGEVNRSIYAFFTKIGLSSRERTKAMTKDV